MLEIKPVNGEANYQRKNWTKPLILPKMQKVKRRLCTSKTKKMKIYIYIYILSWSALDQGLSGKN